MTVTSRHNNNKAVVAVPTPVKKAGSKAATNGKKAAVKRLHSPSPPLPPQPQQPQLSSLQQTGEAAKKAKKGRPVLRIKGAGSRKPACLHVLNQTAEGDSFSVREHPQRMGSFIVDHFLAYDSRGEAEAAARAAGKGREPLFHLRHKEDQQDHFHVHKHRVQEREIDGKPCIVNLHFTWRD